MSQPLLLQGVQLIGAGLVLAAFILVRARKLSPNALPSLWLNFVGSAILAALAVREQQWGFLLLEGVWALVSLQGIITHRRFLPKLKRYLLH